MRVLIIRLGAFGDIIHTLPLAADLAAAGYEVGWTCEDRWAGLLHGNPAVRRLHVLPRAVLHGGDLSWSQRFLRWRRLVRELRAGGYAAVIDAQGLAKSAVLAAGSGAPLRIGHRPPRAREGSWLVGRVRTPVSATHVIDQQRALGLPLMGTRPPRGPWRFPLPAWTAEREWARRWLVRQGWYRGGDERPWLLNVGAGWPTKVWPRQRQVDFAQVAQRRRRPLVLVWGSPAEHDLAEEIIAAAGYGTLAPPTTIPQLAGLLAQAAVVVSGDTGPLHLALALARPAVGLFGPVPAERNGPRGLGYRNLQAPGAAWERHDVSRVDMSVISAEAVVAQVEAVVAEVDGKP